jgi:hypothetical protein
MIINLDSTEKSPEIKNFSLSLSEKGYPLLKAEIIVELIIKQ